MEIAPIQFLNGPQMGHIFPINKTTITIGRDPGNDIVISDPVVSRLHARLTYKEPYWTIEKLSTTNSLLVNSRDVYTAIINDHEIITMGRSTSFLFITGKALQPYQQQSYQQPYQQLPQSQRKTKAKMCGLSSAAWGYLLHVAW